MKYPPYHASCLSAAAATIAVISPFIVGCGGDGSHSQPNWCSDVTVLQPPVSIAIGEFYADGGTVCVVLEDKDKRWLALTHTKRAHMTQEDTFVPNQLYIGKPEEVYDDRAILCEDGSLEASKISDYLVEAIRTTEDSYDPAASDYHHQYNESEPPEISAAKAILQGLHTDIPASHVKIAIP